MVTVSAVRPPARFGAIKLKGDQVTMFKEKSYLDEGWINGGFFVCEKKCSYTLIFTSIFIFLLVSYTISLY